MDSSGSDKARDLARALVTLGYGLSYIMEGGFKAWIEAELPVVEGTEYDASTGESCLLLCRSWWLRVLGGKWTSRSEVCT